MDAVWGLAFTMVGTFIGFVLLLTFDLTREWMGLGDQTRTGLPAFLHDLMFGESESADAVPAE